ncbi:MAG: hypothetical protein RLZ75_1269 [Pseudomonadota bacterium]
MISFSPCKIFLLLVTTLLLTACSSAPKPPPPLVFNVKANSQTNNGGLFYFVVRSANEKEFMLESYRDVASKAFSDPPDPGVLGVFSIVPGTKQECVLSQPTQSFVALYFLFTEPGSQWKKLISMPFEDKYTINLKANSQVEIKESKSWYSWF